MNQFARRIPIKEQEACGTILPLNLSTGVDDNGNLIGFGAPDDDWKLVVAPPGVPTGNVTVVPRARSHFVDLEPNARWVSATEQTGVDDAPFGFYTYETSFVLTLNAGETFVISGEYAADNRLIDIRLNNKVAFVGPNVDGSSCPATGCEEFNDTIAFVIDDQSLFVDGLNVVQITVENQGPTLGNPTSLVLRATVCRWPNCP